MTVCATMPIGHTGHMIPPRKLALLYALFASLAVLLLASAMPPLQNADEPAHAFRADQVSYLGLIGVHLYGGSVGGTVDAGLVTESQAVAGLKFNEAAKVSRDMYRPLAWGPLTTIGFSSAPYPPFFYGPAAVAVAWARHVGTPIPHTLVLMRLAMSATTIVIATVAIALADTAAIWLFAVLLLPMSLALTAAITQDGPMLACTALAVALCGRARNPHTSSRLVFAGLCILLALVAMARPPYAAFAVLVLMTRYRLAWRLAGVAGIVLAVGGWSALNIANVVVPHMAAGVVDPHLQMLGILWHPLAFMRAMAVTLWRYGPMLAQNFVGTLGWLDTHLPIRYHFVTRAMLLMAVAAAWLAGTGKPRLLDMAWVVLAVAAACFGLALIQYLTWTVVGAPAIEGLQGRYFLMPALILGVILGRPRAAPPPAAATWLAIPVMAWPIISIAVTMHAVIARYYF